MDDYQRWQANERLEQKFRVFNRDRQWRDLGDHYNLQRHKTERKGIAQIVSNILRQYKDDGLRILAEIDRVCRNNPVHISWYRSFCTDKWGNELFENFSWKEGWEQPVWQNESWFRDSIWSKVHQVHKSEDNPSQIAYNRSIDNIKRNIQTRTKPGKYLTQFFSDVLDQDDIREWAEKQIAFASCVAELKFVENDDPDGWERVYEEGPQSCMRGSDSVRVYCYPDNGLRLAYLEQGDDIVARAIVRNGTGDETGYIRLYATEQRWTTALKEALDAAGYDKQTYLDGVKLKRIDEDHDCRDGVVCPYLDCGNGGSQMVDIHDKYLLVTDNGQVTATYTGGTIPLYEGRECDCCGSHDDEDDMTYVESSDETVCDHCLNEHYTYAYGRRHQDYFPNDDVIHCESDAEWYHQEYASYHDVYQCRVSDDWYHIDDLVCCEAGQYEGDYVHTDEAVRTTDDQYVYQGDCTKIDGEWVLDDHVATCHITGDSIDIRKSVKINTHLRQARYSNHVEQACVYVGKDSWTAELIIENFVWNAGLLLTRNYYGNDITDVLPFEPNNVEYGDDFEGEKATYLLDEHYILAEAA